MPTNHAVVAAIPISTPASPTLLRNLLVQQMAYVVADAAAAADLVTIDPTTGAVIQVIVCLGRVYLFDPLDTTTAHDGVSVLVSSSGGRYKLSENSDVLVYSVLSRDSTPPVSPSIGDAYLILASPSPTGVWVGHPNEIGIETARGQEFITPVIGRLIYVEDEDAYYRKKADGTITIGFGINALAAGSVQPSQMSDGAGMWRPRVENQTTNAEPAVTNGVWYVVGPSPTGAVWAGKAGQLVHGEAGVWVSYPPAEGWRIYDKALDVDYLYTGSAWITAAGRWTMNIQHFTASGTYNKTARLIGALVKVVGAGGSSRGDGGNGGTGGTSSFGAHCSATGGAGGTDSAGGAGGAGSGGDRNRTGQNGAFIPGDVGIDMVLHAALPPSGGQYGRGGRVTGRVTTGRGGGAGGGEAEEYLDASEIGSSETVTIGAGQGANGAGSEGGTGGEVIVYEFIET